MQNRNRYFLFLSFLEGASVMAAELIGAKMMSPFFGSSLYVWSAVMAITLGGLACGYFVGGLLSAKKDAERKLYLVLIGAALFTVLMPLTSKISLSLFGYFSLLPAVTINAVLILFPPVFLMGMVSPLIIRNIVADAEHAGQSAGTVYAISTAGGILATFGFGFYIIPHFGLTYPCILTGVVLGTLPAIALLKKKESSPILFLLLALWSFSNAKNQKVNAVIDVVYTSEGLLGQIMVLDFPNDLYYGDSTKSGEKSRWLYVNRVSQTMDDPHADLSKNEERYFTYVYRIAEVLDTFSPHRRNVLLLGLGGGSVAKHLSQMGFAVDACELDARIADVAKRYFELPADVQVRIDDARHHIKTCKKKYDVIIFDTFKGEETPSHIMTMESLAETRLLLHPGGMIFINSFGYIEGKKGQGTRSIYSTLKASGFYTEVWPTGEDENQRNLLFVASEKSFPTHRDFIAMNTVDLSDARVLQDAYPLFEIINARAGLAWRRAAIQTLKMDEYQRGIPVFE